MTILYSCNISLVADPSIMKELLDKLVVLKINDDEGTKMGFDGPKYGFCHIHKFIFIIICYILCIGFHPEALL